MMRKWLIVACSALMLSACEQEHTDIQSWMAEEEKRVQPKVAKVEPPKEFEPFRYEALAKVDPFSSAKVDKVTETAVATSSSGLRPDLNRRREALESFPLDTVKMVGHIRRGGTDLALLNVSNAIYTVKVGNYIGQNFGKVTRITEGEIQLKELVQDATGDWVARDTTIQLQEASAKN